MRIMIVEDEPASAEYIQAIIARYAGHCALAGIAENGKVALAMLESSPADVVITDIAMPVMDGLALVEALKSRFAHVKTVLVSGYQDFDYARQALRFGVRDYILKPVNARELIDCLTAIEKELEGGARASRPYVAADENTNDRDGDIPSRDPLFSSIEDYISLHIAKRITLSSLCRHCGVSQTTANRLFRRYTGMSFLEYLTKRRIDRARELLEISPHLMIKEVAHNCGFGDPLYFSKVFKTCVGCAPSEYIQRTEDEK
ncbi:MAG: response regulator [Clostridia bacterium]|nr:response regulator [Clostridia bacterium]